MINLHLQFFLIKKNVFGSAKTTMTVRKALAALNVINPIPYRVLAGSRASTIPTVEVTVFAREGVNGLRDFVVHVFHWGKPVLFRTGAAQGLAASPTTLAQQNLVQEFSLFDRTFSPKLLVGFAVLMTSACFL